MEMFVIIKTGDLRSKCVELGFPEDALPKAGKVGKHNYTIDRHGFRVEVQVSNKLFRIKVQKDIVKAINFPFLKYGSTANAWEAMNARLLRVETGTDID